MNAVRRHHHASDRLETAMTTTAIDFPFLTTVHRPGLPDVHLGFAFPHQAEHASWSLTDDLRNTQHIEGTTITWSPTPDTVSPLAPVPTDPCTLAELVAQENNNLPMGHAFPDLFSRLKAQEGYETAARIWHDACHWLDRNEPEED
jgi:hypothetical protein